ncbi:MAG: antitoxin VbhA family protein [Cyclobacteriaceae bacterium]|nr:antitoxin VbhA family protein [Cyclobacteriaceae bacterium]
MTKEYLNKAPRDYIERYLRGEISIEELKALYKAPKWCVLEDEVFDIEFGCYSLLDKNNLGTQHLVSDDYCSMCVHYDKKNKED